jgi:hypothetical protein
MSSPVLIVTAIESGFGFLLTSAVLFLVISRGRRAYHYLFGSFLLICAIWDLGVFLSMIRNGHLNELDVIGRICITPCILIPALIFHFSNVYSGRPMRWSIVVVWATTFVCLILVFAGVIYRIEGTYTYPWGNMFRVAPSVIDPLIFVYWFGINLWACWLLFRSARRATGTLERRHHYYVLAGFLAVTLAVVKALVTMGVDVSFLLPAGMFLNDVCATVIGLAIVKERLFDITVIVKKGAVYSALAGLLIFVYSFSEHMLITYSGKLIGGRSEIVDLISIAIGIAILMPVKRRIETGVDRYFRQRTLEF